jgi:hypothetical protein
MDALVSFKQTTTRYSWQRFFQLVDYDERRNASRNLAQTVRFFVLIDGLKTIMPTVKFVDDETVTEIINLHSSSQMQTAADLISEWSQRHLMTFNVKKTKEMLLCPILKNPPDQIVLNTDSIERVTSFKLLGITVMNNISWENHVSTIWAKSSKRLHFLTILTRSAVSPTNLLQFSNASFAQLLNTHAVFGSLASRQTRAIGWNPYNDKLLE